MEEIKKAIRTLNNGKAAGPDGIPAEAMKAAQEVPMEVVHPLFEKIWNEEEVPSDWKEGFIVKLPKKGDFSQCKNYRGIMLLSTPGEIFNRIILNEGSGGQVVAGPSSGIQEGQIVPRPNCSTENYRRAITGVENHHDTSTS